MSTIVNTTAISEREFDKFRKLIFQKAGITLSPIKKSLVAGRLGKRLRHYDLNSFSEYYDFVMSPDAGNELQIMVDLLTTNETYFFREPKHFEVLKREILPKLSHGGDIRIWSAASSSGEEAYSIAMTVAYEIGFSRKWKIIGTDISTRVLERARSAVYPSIAAEKIPKEYLREFCLKGVRSQVGTFLMNKRIRERVSFMSLNLNGDWPKLDKFDVILLRNVMIYFDFDTKKTLINRLVKMLKPGGFFIIGHSETLNGINEELDMLYPSVYMNRN